jgi:hypothetical protein
MQEAWCRAIVSNHIYIVDRGISGQAVEQDLGLGVHIRVLCKLADANNSKLHTLKVRLQRERQIHAHLL